MIHVHVEAVGNIKSAAARSHKLSEWFETSDFKLPARKVSGQAFFGMEIRRMKHGSLHGICGGLRYVPGQCPL